MLLAEQERYIYPPYLSIKKYDIRAIKLWAENRPAVSEENFIVTRSERKSICHLRWKHNKRCILLCRTGGYMYIAKYAFLGSHRYYSDEEYDNPKNWEYWSPQRFLRENMKLLIELLNSSVKPRPFKELYSALRTLYEEPIQQHLFKEASL